MGVECRKLSLAATQSHVGLTSARTLLVHIFHRCADEMSALRETPEQSWNAFLHGATPVPHADNVFPRSIAKGAWELLYSPWGCVRHGGARRDLEGEHILLIILLLGWVSCR